MVKSGPVWETNANVKTGALAKIHGIDKEHDFGAFEDEGDRFFWKIDYYDLTLTVGSADPADPAQTARVLTLMLADEY